ncbi:MAG: preprotein translocase subunit SecG [Acidobacteria bacterium]|nr:preprotein translocase subunit SecG [Acidobacteriota bacterium]
MIALLTTIHILTAIVLVLSVLLQSAKGSDVAGAFGGMGSQAAFGPRGTATFLSKATIVMAAVFVITSVSLVRLGSDTVGGGDSVLSEEPTAPAAASAPATPIPAGAIPTPTATVSTGSADGSPAQTAPVVQSIKIVNPPGAPPAPTLTSVPKSGQ